VAQKAVGETIRANGATIREWLESNPEDKLKIKHLSNDDVGFTLTRRGQIRLTRRVIVILKNLDGHPLIVTSFPDPRS
jgi:hypothetical protein